jgi:ABC-type transport system involved in cytochrome bd biosynthesis fused ATPase/permease subunit
VDRPSTASRVVRDVFSAAGDASVLLITHRPEGLELVDEVLTLRAGRIERTPQNAAAAAAAQ